MIDPSLRLRVATANRDLVEQWREGISIEGRTGKPLDHIVHRVTADRLELAYHFRRTGKRLMTANPPMYRDAIGRFYYALYHALRAVVFFKHGGDDHQAHSALPSHTPSDFPDAAQWTNAIKDCREKRNRADYNAYPKSPLAWRQDADQLQQRTDKFLVLSRTYLSGKGCQFL